MAGSMSTITRLKPTTIANVHVFDGNGFTDLTSIAIHGTLISDDTHEFADVVDGEGGFLIPGLIDAHVHVHSELHLQQLLSYGVTTALDMAMWPSEKKHRLCGLERSPALLSAGLPATKAGSVHSSVLPLPKEAFLSGPEAAQSWVQRRVAEGSDYIKIIADVPGPNQKTMDAIVDEAHRLQKMVVAHAATYKPFQMAIQSKVDFITHVALDEAVDAEMAGRMASGGIIAIPTLVMMEATLGRPPLSAIASMLMTPRILKAVIHNRRNGSGTPSYANARDSIAAMRSAGVPILAGTDCHDEPNSFFDVKHGKSMHRELEMLVEAGLSNVEVLRAATIGPASAFHLSDRGQIAPGRRADLVLLAEDPSKDIRASRSIHRIWCNGEQVKLPN